MNKLLELNDKELRDIFNFEKTYELILETYKEILNLPYCLFEKKIKNKSYLYIQKNKESKPTSIGLLNNDNLEFLNKYKTDKEKYSNLYDSLNNELEENIKYLKITKINRVDSQVAKILRKMDSYNLLGTDFLVVGTNAFFAYEIHAQKLLTTNNLAIKLSKVNLDFTYYFEKYKEQNKEVKSNQHKLIKALKEIDKSFNINHRKMFQAINDKGYEVEILSSPSSMINKDNIGGFRPIPLIEQEWLLKGKPIRHILLSNDNKPAPIVAPDPRWMALHKMWLSQKPERNKLKVNKDKNQAISLFNLVMQNMKYEYPFDEVFEKDLPKELINIYDNLKEDYLKLNKNNINKKHNLF